MLSKREALALIGGAAVAVASSGVANASAQPFGFDDQLVSLYRQWLEAERAYDVLYAAFSDLEDQSYAWYPERPDCLYGRVNGGKKFPIGAEEIRAHWKAYQDVYSRGEHREQIDIRFQKKLETARQYLATCDAIDAEHGLKEAEQRYERAGELAADLESRIEAVTPEGMAGIAVKLALYAHQERHADEDRLVLVMSALTALNKMVGLPLYEPSGY